MRRTLKFGAIAGLLFCLNSCGLPAAVGRSTGRAVQAAGGMAAAYYL